MNRFALCLLLLCASFVVTARDVRMHGANGDGGGGCSDEAAAPADTSTPAKHVPVAANRGKAKAPTSFRGSGGGSDDAPHAPRWHSFLPGMFR